MIYLDHEDNKQDLNGNLSLIENIVHLKVYEDNKEVVSDSIVGMGSEP